VCKKFKTNTATYSTVTLNTVNSPLLPLPVVVLGGVIVVLANGPNIRGFKPGGRWVFKGDEIRRTTSFGGEVKPSASRREILRYVKDPCVV
jgi:hypothetical protein